MKKSLLVLIGRGDRHSASRPAANIRRSSSYKPGNYQGKSDTRPWEGGQFAGNKQAWESALRHRNQAQTEYKPRSTRN